jgi:hypothetical protein
VIVIFPSSTYSIVIDDDSGSYVLKEWVATSSKFSQEETYLFEHEAELLKKHSRSCAYITGTTIFS